MANKSLYRVQLRAQVIEGVDPKTGDDIYKNRNFMNVNTLSEPAQLLNTMISIMSLQKYEVSTLDVIDTSALSIN